MTMILGVNLSNRQYIAGDTRLSNLQGDQYVVKSDNIQKVEYLSGKGITQTTVACAGDAAMAKHLIRELRKTPFIHDGASEIRLYIHDWLIREVDNYFTSHGFSEVTLIIGGANPNKKKEVRGERMRELATAYAGKQGGFMYINPDLRKVIKLGKQIPNGKLSLDVNDMILFGVQISQSKGIEFFDTQWGDILVYGQKAGLVRESLTDKEIAGFEFGTPNFQGESQEGRDMAFVNAIVMSNIEKLGLETVGGAVLTFQNLPDGTTIIIAGRTDMVPLSAKQRIMRGEHVESIMTYEILVENNHFYRVTNGTKHRLIPVSKFSSKGSASLFI